MDPCFHVVYAKFRPYHLNVAVEIETRQTRQNFSNLLLSNFGASDLAPTSPGIPLDLRGNRTRSGPGQLRNSPHSHIPLFFSSSYSAPTRADLRG
ncbi:hypothetical protein AOLI_G00148020 [Acnodon oligacanthus]